MQVVKNEYQGSFGCRCLQRSLKVMQHPISKVGVARDGADTFELGQFTVQRRSE
jgi:hypothetical protein